MLRQALGLVCNLFMDAERAPRHVDEAADTPDDRVTDDPQVRLVYFDVKGLGQAIRDLLTSCGYPFDDLRLNRDEFEEQKDTFPFGKLPVLRVQPADGKPFTIPQSKTIMRYLGRITKTVPNRDTTMMSRVDALLELHSEFMFPIQLTMFPHKFGLEWAEEQRSSHRRWCGSDHIPRYLDMLKVHVEDGVLLGLDKYSVADYCWAPTLEWLLIDKSLDDVACGDEELEAYALRFRKYVEGCRDVVSIDGQEVGESCALHDCLRTTIPEESDDTEFDSEDVEHDDGHEKKDR